VPHSHPSYHMLGHLSSSSLQTSFPIIFNSRTFDVLHSHYTINTHFLSVGVECQWGKCFTLKDQTHCELPCGTHIIMLLPLHTNVFYKRYLSVLCHLLHVTPVMRAASYWKIKHLYNTVVSGKEPCLLSMFQTNENSDQTVSYWTDVIWRKHTRLKKWRKQLL
jgi:hypothetical protein